MRTLSADQLPTSVLEACFTLGNRVRASRKARGLTQQALCASAGLARSTLLEIENGSPRVQFAYWLLVLESLGLLESLTQTILPAEMALVTKAVPRPRRAP